MSEQSPFENDFLFPRIQKQNALQEQIRALDSFRKLMSEEDQSVFDDLLKQVERHSSISYLAPRQSPYEHLLLTMMLEIHKETANLKDKVRCRLTP